MIQRLFIFLTCLASVGTVATGESLVYEGQSGAGLGKHIVFLAGDHEYRSEESLPALARILNRIEDGDPQAASQLLPLVYEELRKPAATRMSQEAAGHTLQPTALVHEAFLRLAGGDAEREWDNRGHFFAAAAEAMRRILIDNARKRNSAKRGGGKARQDLRDDDAVLNPDDSDTLLELDEALTRLAVADADLARMVELRYFTGLTIEETAQVLGVSERTTKRNWAYARAWLKRAMNGDDSDSSENS